MKRIFHVFCGLLAVILSLTSCLGSSDSDITTYNDVAIKSFSLGKLNRYIHTTTKSGADSVYKATFTASSYKMNIDQLKHTISNADSLPIGTDKAHIICTVTTANNGIVYLKSLMSDTLKYFSSGNDSVDFTQPRVFRVFSSDGLGYRDYLVSLNVRSQEAGKFGWMTADESCFPEPEDSLEQNAAEEAGLFRANRTSQYMYRRLKLKRLQDVRVFTDFEPRTEDSLMVYESHSPDATVDLVLLPNDGEQPTFRDRHILLRGINEADEFYQPDYGNMPTGDLPADYRRTLYWNPNAVCDEKGRFTATFYNNAKETRIRMTAAGISGDGRLMHSR